MTRRIAAAILLTVWATLLLAGATAYFVTRSMLLTNLDQSIMLTALSRPELTDVSGNRVLSQMQVDADDRFFIRDASGRSIASIPPKSILRQQDPAHAPKLIRAEFTSADDGTRSRTVTFQAYGKSPENAGEKAKPVIVTYRGSADEFEETMSLLTWTLIGSGLVGGIVAAFATRAIARAALRPVSTTADIIGSIDERALNQRIEPHRLPPELRPVALRCNEMLARLENAFTRRRRFLADASHELRTPVAALMTTLEVTLRRPRSEAEYLDALRSALEDARLMRSLVEALMNQARSEIDALEEPRERINVAGAVEQVLSSLTALAEQRGIALQQHVDRNLTLNIQPSRLRSVLLNLVGNAIEHNRTGGCVRVSAHREPPANAKVADAQDRAAIVVSDDGPGIAAEHAVAVFEPFYRADRSRGADGHLGLGLFLVKTHVQKMGGEITLKSEVGQGATFRIELPVERCEELPDQLGRVETGSAVPIRVTDKLQEFDRKIAVKSA